MMIGILLMFSQQENVFHHNTFFMAIYTASFHRTPTQNHPRDISRDKFHQIPRVVGINQSVNPCGTCGIGQSPAMLNN